MIIIFPLVPVVIAALVLILGVLGGLSESLGTISNIIWVILTITFAGFLLCNIFRKNYILYKLIGAGITIAAATIAMFTTKIFLVDDLAEIVAKDSLGGLIEFGFELLIGGALWLLAIWLCGYASFAYLDDEEEWPSSIFSLIGGILLCVLFFAVCR